VKTHVVKLDHVVYVREDGKGNHLVCRMMSHHGEDTAHKISHAINQHEKLVAGIKEAANAMDKPAVQGEGDWQRGMFCGLEDRGITDRYDACVYGYDKALERVQEWVIAGLEALLDEEENE